MIQGASSQQPSGRLGRAWNSSRLAATTNGWEWSGRRRKRSGTWDTFAVADLQGYRRGGGRAIFAGGSVGVQAPVGHFRYHAGLFRRDGAHGVSALSAAGRLRRSAGRSVRRGWRADHRAGAGVQLQRAGLFPGHFHPPAVGTSLATIVFTSVNSILTHHRLGAVRWPMVLWMTFGILLGAALGSLTAAAIQGRCCRRSSVCSPGDGGTDGLRPASKGHRSCTGTTRTVAGGRGDRLGVRDLRHWRRLVIGPVPDLAQRADAAGGGDLGGLRAADRRRRGVEFHGGRLARGAPATVEPGFLYLPALLGIAATSMFFARLGARLAHRLSAKVLKRLFALLLLSVGINFLV